MSPRVSRHLNNGEGGVTKWEGGGGASEVLSQRRGGGGVKGGWHNKIWGSFNTVVIAILKGGGAQKIYPVFQGVGGTQSCGPVIFQFCSTPPHN